VLEVGVVPRDRQSRPVLGQRRDEGTLAVMGFRQAFDRREILGCALQDLLELSLRVFELTELEKRASEGHTCGVIGRVNFETRATGIDGVLEWSGATVLFGELRKRNRRRVLLDPSSKTFKTRRFRHPALLNLERLLKGGLPARIVGHRQLH
jgi:hypothetical protein